MSKMRKNKKLVTAEVCKKDDFQDSELGSVLNPDGISEDIIKRCIEEANANSGAAPATGNILNLKGEHKMNREEFWGIISSTTSAKDQEEQFMLICEEVIKLSEAEIVSFDENMRELLSESRTEPLLEVFVLTKIGCSDDHMGCSNDAEFEFADFRLWLMSKGRFVFESVLKKPDSLAFVLTQRDIDDGVSLGGLLFIAYQIYEKRTGKKLWPELEDGRDFDDAINKETHRQLIETIDINEMYKRYPNLMQRFSDRYLRLNAKVANGGKLTFEFNSWERVESHDLVTK